jgi:hypothetical protein
MMFGRVTDFNVRGNLRAPAGVPKVRNPFYLNGFSELDDLVCTSFLANLPPWYKHNFGLTEAPDCTVDTDLYMVHIIPHAYVLPVLYAIEISPHYRAAITLHYPYLEFSDSQNVSSSRCVSAARAILSAYYLLSSTSLDICRLHPFVTVCGYHCDVSEILIRSGCR